jgi:hypothetical protein
MFGLTTSQLICFCVGILATLAAWWMRARALMRPQKHLALYMTAIMAVDVAGVLVQHFVVKDTPYGLDSGVVRAARLLDMAAYVGWPFALANLAILVFDDGKIWQAIGRCVGVAWCVAASIIVRTYPTSTSSAAEIDAHKHMVDHIFTGAHVLGVIVGLVMAARFYGQKRWPLLPHIATTIIVLGALSDCAGQYANAKPSADYDLSSIVGILVYTLVFIAHVFAGAKIARGVS